MVIDQRIPFNKPNKKVMSEKMMQYLIPQTKHVVSPCVWQFSPYKELKERLKFNHMKPNMPFLL
jgi:hypothetical protein